MSTRAQLLAEIAAQFPDNTTGLITPAKLRQVVEDVTNSCLVSETDAGTAGIAVLQSETQAQALEAVGADPSGTAATAVSTHNTATDAHADIRTLVAGKQDSLTISDVGEAMLALATPSGQKIPRVNADGSVVLINVPSGDGVGGSSWYASDDGPPSVDISLSWVSNGDANGVFRALGAESGTWSNPASSGRIRSLASSIYAGADAVEFLTDRNTTSTTTNNVANSWFAFDLGVGTTLALDSYSLQGRGKDLNHQLRTWVIEGATMSQSGPRSESPLRHGPPSTPAPATPLFRMPECGVTGPSPTARHRIGSFGLCRPARTHTVRTISLLARLSFMASFPCLSPSQQGPPAGRGTPN